MLSAQNIDLGIFLLSLFFNVLSTAYVAYQKYIALTPAQKHDRAKSIVRSVVAAVEQQCSAMDGPSKKAEAVRVSSQLLRSMGINIPPDLLDTLIEAAVFMLNTGLKDLAATQAVPAVKITQ